MKRLSVIVMLLVLVATAFSAESKSRSELIREKLVNGDTTSVIVVAHRGNWRTAPENSIAAIEAAVDMGVDMIEIDVQRTADSVLVLMHDDALERTTTGQGKISELLLDSIRTVNLKDVDGNVTGCKVPTLEEALSCAKGRIMLNLDKADRYFPQVYDLLEKTGTTEQIVMKGHRPVDKVKEDYGHCLDRLIYMPIIVLDNDGAREKIESYIEGMHPAAFEFVYKNPENPLPEQLRDALAGRTLIWYNTMWTVLAGGHHDDAALEDPEGHYGYVIDTLGARILQTDRPAYMLEYLRTRNLHD